MAVSAKHWRIFDDVPNDTSTTSFEYVELREKSNASPIPAQQSQYKFEMNDVDAYVLPSKAYLQVRLKIVDAADDTSFGSVVGLQNSGMLFQRAEYLVNSVSIDRVEEAHYNTLLRNLLDYSDDYTATGGSDQMWAKDTGSLDNVRPLYLTTASQTLTAGSSPFTVTGTEAGALSFTTVSNGGNDGYKTRTDLFGSGANTVVLRIPLRRIFGFCNLNRVSIGVRHSIYLTKVSDWANCVHTATNPGTTTARVQFQEMSIWMPYLKPSISQATILNSQLANNATHLMSYEYSNVYIKNFSSSASIKWDVTNISERVNKIVVCMVPTADLTDQTANSAIFQHNSVTSFNIKLGSFRYPNSDVFRSDFSATGNNWTRLYHEYLRCSNKLFDVNSGNAISYTTFRDIYPLFCCDVRNQDENLYSPGHPVDLRIEFELTAPGADVTLICMVQSDRELQMDIKDRKTFLEVK